MIYDKMMKENLYEICNGSQLQRFNGKKVSVTGLVVKVNPNGITFDMRTTDDLLIKVNCRKPISGPLEGYVEVHGTAQDKTIICEDIIHFAMDQVENFDVIAHNSLCKILHSAPNLYKASRD